jgi:hypothetical protein
MSNEIVFKNSIQLEFTIIQINLVRTSMILRKTYIF